MKKIFVLLLCLATVFSLAGCGSQNEASVIDLGGGLGEITLEGDAYGKYEKIETPEELVFEDTETTLYEDLNCDTPYIAVYRFAKEDYTLEEIAKEEADLYCKGYYQLFDSNGIIDQSGAYMCSGKTFNGSYYYIDTEIFEDGDDFVEIDMYGKTEELQIGDSDVYAWVPAGYTDLSNDEYKEKGTLFCGEYGEDYYFPYIWIGKFDSSYEYANWYWEAEYPDGIPYTEKEYNELISNWDEGDLPGYYEKLGFSIVFASRSDDTRDYNYEGEYTVLSGINDATEIWFEVDDAWYSAWFESDLSPRPAYADTFLTSLHKK